VGSVKIFFDFCCNTGAVWYCGDMTTNLWTLEQRQNAQNKNFRHDRLCVSVVRPVKQATRYEPSKELPMQWCGHSCVGNVYFKTIDAARLFASEMGYEGILL
jgi:hypothetical protein